MFDEDTRQSLTQLKEFLDDGLITKEVWEEEQKKVLARARGAVAPTRDAQNALLLLAGSRLGGA